MNQLKEENAEFIATVLLFKAQEPPFHDYFFLEEVTTKISPLAWWKSFENKVPEHFLDYVLRIFSCVASSAGLERLFSTFGFVHSKIRNKLGVEKASKLVTIFKEFN